MLHRLLAAAVIGGFAAFPLAAFADAAPARVVSVANAPVTVTRCTVDLRSDGFIAFANITNRTLHRLSSLTVGFRYFDEEGPIGQGTLSFTPGELLASGDSAAFSQGIGGGAFPSFRFATCRIASATFVGGRKWVYGQAFPEKLLPLSFDQSSSGMPDSNMPIAGAQNTDNSGGAAALPSSLVVTLGQSWVTNVPSNIPNAGSFVHVRVTLAAPSAIEVWPSEFRVNMTLANGATKAYSPLRQPAPLVLRGGLFTYTGDPHELGPSIAPSEDFGAIGKMSLQPNVPVTTVLTYQVGQVDQSDSIHVALIR